MPARASLAVDVRAWTVARAGPRRRRTADPGTGHTRDLAGPPRRAQPTTDGGGASAQLLTRAVGVAGWLGLPPVEGVGVGGASDGNFTAGIGTPTLDGLGAVGGGAHAAHEFVLVDRLVDRTRLVAGLTHDLLQEDL